MKIRLWFKTPDVVSDALDRLTDEQREEAEAVISKFIKYGECVTIEIDTETGKAEVCGAR